MHPAFVGIFHDNGVTRTHIAGELTQDRLNCRGQCAEMDRHAEPLHHHLAARIAQYHGEIEQVADERRICRGDEHSRHLVRDAGERMLDDRCRDRVECTHAMLSVPRRFLTVLALVPALCVEANPRALALRFGATCDFSVAAPPWVKIRRPCGSTHALNDGGTRVVESACSITAGPLTTLPA